MPSSSVTGVPSSNKTLSRTLGLPQAPAMPTLPEPTKPDDGVILSGSVVPAILFLCGLMIGTVFAGMNPVLKAMIAVMTLWAVLWLAKSQLMAEEVETVVERDRAKLMHLATEYQKECDKTLDEGYREAYKIICDQREKMAALEDQLAQKQQLTPPKPKKYRSIDDE